MRLFAPAKINWTLEVLGRRDDGYHEVRSIMQTIDLCDVVEIEPAGGLRLEVEGPHEPSEDDLVLRAAALLDRGSGRGARVHIAKRIPVAAGLGGGSSDAAAALRSLNELWGLGHPDEALSEMGARLGSDVPFFIHGGTCRAEGRGERVTPLPEPAAPWLVLLAPPLTLADKTRRMYEALRPEHFSDGSRTEALARRIGEGGAVEGEALCNSFEAVAYDVFPELGAYRDALLAAGAPRAHLAGSGPALFCLAPDEAAARAVKARLRPPGGRAQVIRTLGSAEALRREG